MVDFGKRLSRNRIQAIVDPLELYETLDRAHDKGPLRPSQQSVLAEWFKSRRSQRDVIVKLHTGQGKTLIGLLILQSRLHENRGPVLYLCPNNFLIAQTCEQAEQFGISTCTPDPELPDDFYSSKKVLVTSVKKLFNGLTKFGLKNRSASVGTLLMDDAHACSDAIRDSFRIKITRDDPAYNELMTLFEKDLIQQGQGTYADIANKKYNDYLPVPYWSWLDHENDISKILSKGSDRESIKFVWPLIKDSLTHCQCIVSGAAIEIEPYVPPLDVFGTYWKAAHRVFMSATVTDDAFLVKGLQLAPDTIVNPLTYKKESWSGEKMVLIPSLIHDDLSRTEIVHLFGVADSVRTFGIVVLSSSFKNTQDWKQYGALVADKDNIGDRVQNLKDGKFAKTVVLVNRYDGVDLPDNTCRILIFDGKPYSESLVDLYQERCRATSQSTLVRTVRTIEQGLGRSVRGEKDYSVVIILDLELTRLLRDSNSRTFFSPQMDTQVQIGLEIAAMAKQEIEDGEPPITAFSGLINQCIKRDTDWKAFYIDKMRPVGRSSVKKDVLQIYRTELKAEQLYLKGDYKIAAKELQNLIDTNILNKEDKAWYLQEMARFNYVEDRLESQTLQVAAYKSNRSLLRPPSGVTVTKLTILSRGRLERIINWIRKYGDYDHLNIAVSDILTRLSFGAESDKFEQALNELSFALGFKGERPDKEWKEGPDNLWALDDERYILWECKSEVDSRRLEINKRETGQMNQHCAWFDRYYKGHKVKSVLIHPARTLQKSAALTHEINIMDKGSLPQFVKTVRQFFNSFTNVDFQDLSQSHIQQLIDNHRLSVKELFEGYTKRPHVKR